MCHILKNPNGYGSVYKLSGKRRKPWGVRKTIGWDENGKQLYQNIGYYADRSEAMMALAEFNKNPYTTEASQVTFAELFDLWSKDKFKKVSKSNINGYNASFKISKTLHNMKFVDIRKTHLQKVIDNCNKGHATLRKIKVLFNQLFKHALENDLVQKDYSKFVEIGANTEESKRKPFSKNEVSTLWTFVDRMDFIDTILIMIYTGLRPGELLSIKNAEIELDKRIMRGGSKTKAGKNRVIPIHERILPFIEARYNKSNEYFIVNHENKQMKYWNYYEEKWKKIMEQLEMEHKPHDCRHTFASRMHLYGADKLYIKRIMGHASSDITDKVYTHTDIEQLIAAVDLLK